MAEGDLDLSLPRSKLYFLSAFLAMEPPTSLISLARVFGGGTITADVQSFICQRLLTKSSDAKYHAPYLRNFLKKLIVEIESTGQVVFDEMYENYASMLTSFKEYDLGTGNSRVLKSVSFLFPDESIGVRRTYPESKKLLIPLQCSLNMLEGDTGCSLWPSSLFLSEFILSFPELFSNKSCFEVGSGIGLVGICLAHVKSCKVILSDGDLSTLANMKLNLGLNQLGSTDEFTERTTQGSNSVECIFLPWETAEESELQQFMPDIVLGADVIYDPSCLPHLVRVLSILLKPNSCNNHHDQNANTKKKPVAYVASVIRNIDTFNCFQTLASEANLSFKDITENVKLYDLLPYMLSYTRSNVRLLTLSYNSL